MPRTVNDPTRVRIGAAARGASGRSRLAFVVVLLCSLGAAFGQAPSPDVVEVVLGAGVSDQVPSTTPETEGLAAAVASALAAVIDVDDPFDADRYQPMPVPLFDPTPATRSLVAPGVVRFDHATARETRIQTDSLEVPPTEGDDPEIHGDESLLPSPRAFGPLQRVVRPWETPSYRPHVKLFFTVPGAGSFVCSGTLIDSFHVLTAGHCVYHFEAREWSRDIVVIPAYEDGHEPYHRARGTVSWAWNGWIDHRDFSHDVGLVRLSRPVGGATGWQGYGGIAPFTGGPGFEANRCLLVPTRGDPLETPGYPAGGAYAPGRLMYTHSGTWDGCPEYRPWYHGPAIPGQSGSGVLTSERIAFAIMTHGYSDGRGGHTLVTLPKFEFMRARIREVTPTSFDLAPLVVTTSDDVYTAGERLTGLSFFLHNLSTEAREADVRIDVILVDVDRGTSRIVGTHDVRLAFRAKSIVRFGDDTIVIPTDVPAGTYHVVVRASSSADSNRANDRTMPPDSGTIRVLAAAGPDPEPDTARLLVTARPAPDQGAREGDRDVVVMHLEAAPPEQGPAVTVTSLRFGVIDMSPARAPSAAGYGIFDGVRVYHDPSGSGTLVGASELAFAAGFDAGGEATLVIDEPFTVLPGEPATLLVTVDVTTPRAGRAAPFASAGIPGLPLGIGIGALGLAIRRRHAVSALTKRVLMLALVITPLVVACHEVVPPDPREYAYRTDLHGVDAVAGAAPVTVAELPIEGSVVRVRVP